LLPTRQFDEAESYADSGAKVAAAVLNPFAYADMHELKGDAQMGQEKLTRAHDVQALPGAVQDVRVLPSLDIGARAAEEAVRGGAARS
jgi:hypothetical protein